MTLGRRAITPKTKASGANKILKSYGGCALSTKAEKTPAYNNKKVEKKVEN